MQQASRRIVRSTFQHVSAFDGRRNSLGLQRRKSKCTMDILLDCFGNLTMVDVDEITSGVQRIFPLISERSKELLMQRLNRYKNKGCLKDVLKVCKHFAKKILQYEGFLSLMDYYENYIEAILKMTKANRNIVESDFFDCDKTIDECINWFNEAMYVYTRYVETRKKLPFYFQNGFAFVSHLRKHGEDPTEIALSGNKYLDDIYATVESKYEPCTRRINESLTFTDFYGGTEKEKYLFMVVVQNIGDTKIIKTAHRVRKNRIKHLVSRDDESEQSNNFFARAIEAAHEREIIKR